MKRALRWTTAGLAALALLGGCLAAPARERYSCQTHAHCADGWQCSGVERLDKETPETPCPGEGHFYSVNQPDACYFTYCLRTPAEACGEGMTCPDGLLCAMKRADDTVSELGCVPAELVTAAEPAHCPDLGYTCGDSGSSRCVLVFALVPESNLPDQQHICLPDEVEWIMPE